VPKTEVNREWNRLSRTIRAAAGNQFFSWPPFEGHGAPKTQGKAAALVIEVSDISYGLIQSLREKQVNIVDYKPKGDKQERLISQIDLFEGGSVLLPKDAPWLDAFVSELLSFPGRHDDQVDALSQGLAWRREAWKAPLVQRTTYGRSGYAPPPSNPGPASQ
jgi:Terminase RNaseH-like domain